MARSFTNKDAARVLDEHDDLLRGLREGADQLEKSRTEIKNAVDRMMSQAVMKTLETISIEELNREKKGFRIKALRDHGYHTMADLAAASVYNIASVHGVSEDAAYAIKKAVNSLSAKASAGAKIQLSIDDQNAAATQVVTAIRRSRQVEPIAEKCKSMLAFHQRRIIQAMADLEPGLCGRLGWLFVSSSAKQKAERAYNYLGSLLVNDYGREADTALAAINQRITAREAWMDFAQNPFRYYNIIEDIVPGVLGNDDSVYGLPEDLAREIQDEGFYPEGLLCTLRRYQEWGVKYILHQERVLLGDEMGLGKTVQAIAAMVSLRNTGATHFVVVCPASVIVNWCREITKHSTLRPTKVHGPGRMAALRSWIKSGGVAVTTYETTGYFKLEEAFSFSMLVVDEAHYIKNESAKRTQNVKEIALHAERMLFMTGTALENKVDEMIALIAMLQPLIAMRVQGMASLSSAPQFREAVAPVYYRRKREDVLTELPEKSESEEWCTLGAQEEQAYEESALNKNYAEMRRVSWSVDDLRQSSKACRMLELIEEVASEGRKIIVFSFFLNTIRKISLLLGDRCLDPINGSVTPQRRQEIIDEFDKAPAGTVLLSQIQAGGTGLNIQSASVVILCEPQLKPSIENQAISRVYRMGQTRKVLVYRLLTENTIEERMMKRLAEKQREFDAFADKSVAAAESIELDEKTFGDIIKEEIERINKERASRESDRGHIN